MTIDSLAQRNNSAVLLTCGCVVTVSYGDRQELGRMLGGWSAAEWRERAVTSNGRMPFAILATLNTPLSTLALFW